MRAKQHTFKSILYFALPFSLQGVLVTSLGFIDSLMISSLGDVAIAASGIGARWFWFASLFLLSISTGVSIFWAQFSGAGDIDKFRNSLAQGGGAILFSTLVVGMCFIVFPNVLSQVVASKGAATEYSIDYLVVLGSVVMVTGVGLTLDAALRCLGRPLIPMYTYMVEFALNVFLNYVLIFGAFGAPELGLLGAGIASLLARTIRILFLLLIIAMSEPRIRIDRTNLRSLSDKKSLIALWVVTWPVIAGSFVWSAGNFSFHAVFGHMGEHVLAAMSVITPIEWVALAAVAGIGQGTAVLIGNKLGADEFEEAIQVSRESLVLAVLFGVSVGVLLMISATYMDTVFINLSDPVINIIQEILPLVALSVVLRAVTSTQVGGILRSGGDTKYCLYLDTVAQWVIAVPVVAIGALYFELPLIVVYLLVQVEELFKIIPATLRIKQRKWLKNLVSDT